VDQGKHPAKAGARVHFRLRRLDQRSGWRSRQFQSSRSSSPLDRMLGCSAMRARTFGEPGLRINNRSSWLVTIRLYITAAPLAATVRAAEQPGLSDPKLSGRSFCPCSGRKMEVHYRWHPYFGCTVRIRRVEQRATGLFLKVQGPAGVVCFHGCVDARPGDVRRNDHRSAASLTRAAPYGIGPAVD